MPSDDILHGSNCCLFRQCTILDLKPWSVKIQFYLFVINLAHLWKFTNGSLENKDGNWTFQDRVWTHFPNESGIGIIADNYGSVLGFKNSQFGAEVSFIASIDKLILEGKSWLKTFIFCISISDHTWFAYCRWHFEEVWWK